MLVILKTVLKAFGLSSWTGTGTIALGLIMALAAAAAWMREEAKNECNAAWSLQIEATKLAMQKELNEKSLQLKELEKKLLVQEAETDAKERADKEKLSGQKSQVELSNDCSKCRVPNARIWLRASEGGGQQSQLSATK